MKTAMILAAGRGERLRPFTDRNPKSLCHLLGKPLLAHHLNNLHAAQFQRVIINHAYLGGHIKRFLYHYDTPLEIIFSPEPPGALETGGGIVNALDKIGSDPFVTLNGDTFIDYDLNNLKLPENSLAHAILVPKPDYRHTGDYGLTAEGLLENANPVFIFSGLTIYRPEFFHSAIIGRYSVTPQMRAHAENQKITGELYRGKWFDIGTPEQWKMAQSHFNSNHVPDEA